MIKYLRLILLPFSVFYGLVVVCRNQLYNMGLFKSTSFDIPVICVGNLVVGGSGKSPVTEYLVNLLGGYKIAILSRGYGRKTKGFILADERATAETIGDEPMQFYHKFAHVTVAVCEDRVKGIRLLKDQHDVIILDDAYQHRAVRAGFNVLLFEYEKLLKRQFLLPAGNLREPFSGYKRADLLLVTKAPGQLDAIKRSMCKDRFNEGPPKQLFFSFITYGNLKHLFSGQEQVCSALPADTSIFLLTGIANPAPLVSHLKNYSANIRHYDYPDHYQFGKQNILQLVNAFNSDPKKEKIIVTTEKDAQRLLAITLKELLLNLPVFYLPIKIALQDEDKTTFDQKILNYVSSTTRNR
ncbi:MULTISPECIES: tetraacyldisaccharide 4'-kinase [Pedobacter]|uniref:Tetraacyldisaccharide 4'-kinase n=1 Tax=Pedobacter heparinus (strain ATCC 13125 / DSM 2366 / CIP 104194 / JCM 7457 / NBRC 12017 / NCIMB 9290 / NRRL B-14731 / HIM 762-3) TaxID=485917 RepID=C6Y191_PEDHD|nr:MULTISPECIES: tetraacyldisaccharide 4'-kinase [Pedobacter]ACU02867.1 tetraacyldisaccharide 4'-kinase [Pedobacter heparinus DSM 2366]MBB5438256.1 tetraacyldisaccharide 4'-kinase [Pedobacter sp. AK017]